LAEVHALSIAIAAIDERIFIDNIYL
jgi:hypothetical protein